MAPRDSLSRDRDLTSKASENTVLKSIGMCDPSQYAGGTEHSRGFCLLFYKLHVTKSLTISAASVVSKSRPHYNVIGP